ncbi:O-antigen ligase domain-containing protein [Hyunsoonleella flava]|uniref:O-antigen ligase domain-containing protein n=1 Tax=Hyunsoonleella flava TaxID=2527939 RepID=A0A4V2JA37_9FLAO|nr:O-antigen ligase family protein [Hyunsoonleella flava]TBN03616.1 O-antigen ligase domain-containing protein [Hyunsoonleella flava]
MTKSEYINKRIELLFKSVYVKIALALMVISYFYNLPALKYSAIGENELRLYDITGLVILFIVFNNLKLFRVYIKSKSYFKYMHTFILWAGFSLIFNLIFSLYKARPLWFVQTCLYYYHLIVFFYTAILMAMYLRKRSNYKTAASLVLILAIAEGLLVFAQHAGLVPFLWNDVYKMSYGGFLSGALGPNKINLGMNMLFSFVFATGLLLQPQLKINKILNISALLISFATIGVSGSRTTYLALIVFICYLFVLRTRKFFGLSLIISLGVIVAFFLNLELIETITTTIENRVVNKVSDPRLLTGQNLDVGELYEDLGSGRKQLSIRYLYYLLENPLIIPLGIGLNNRLLIQFSAHNIYLSLINEVGLVGLFFYFKWISNYLFLKFGRAKSLKSVLNGLIVAMLVTLFFGEHLYIYRSLFTILGYFLLITVMLIAPRYYFLNARKK